jgi:phosphatidate cytidylyltransferase
MTKDSPDSDSKGNLTIRVAVATVGIPLIVFFVMAGGFLLYAFILAVALLALREFYELSRIKGISPQVLPGMIFGGLLVTVFLHIRVRSIVAGMFMNFGIEIPYPSMTQVFLILYLVFVLLVLIVELFRKRKGAIENIAATILGPTYVGLFLGTVVGIRELFVPENIPLFRFLSVSGPVLPMDVEQEMYRWGGYTVVTVFAAIWMCDSAAYFAGKGFGRHLLFERVSPGKTWEGALAGLIFAVLTFVVGRAAVLPYMGLTTAIVCGGIVGVFGQLGDLTESLLKRDAGVKDSSALIPGHGGVLDRFDSLLFAAPLIFLYIDFIVF